MARDPGRDGDEVLQDLWLFECFGRDYNNNNNNKDFIYRGGHVTAEKLTNLWPSKTEDDELFTEEAEKEIEVWN